MISGCSAPTPLVCNPLIRYHPSAVCEQCLAVKHAKAQVPVLPMRTQGLEELSHICLQAVASSHLLLGLPLGGLLRIAGS